SQAPLAWRTRTTSTACPSWPGATIAASITGSACASACIGSARVGERRLDEDHVAAQELAGRDAREQVQVPAPQLAHGDGDRLAGQGALRERVPVLAGQGCPETALGGERHRESPVSLAVEAGQERQQRRVGLLGRLLLVPVPGALDQHLAAQVVAERAEHLHG